MTFVLISMGCLLQNVSEPCAGFYICPWLVKLSMFLTCVSVLWWPSTVNLNFLSVGGFVSAPMKGCCKMPYKCSHAWCVFLVLVYKSVNKNIYCTTSGSLPRGALDPSHSEKNVFSSWLIWELAVFGRSCMAEGCPFQVVGPRTEKEQCLSHILLFQIFVLLSYLPWPNIIFPDLLDRSRDLDSGLWFPSSIDVLCIMMMMVL